MKTFLIALSLSLSTIALADLPPPTTTERPTTAATALQVDPQVIVIDIDDARRLKEETAPKAAVPSTAVQPTPAPSPPETKVIELDPPPVVIVNRTNHFRILSRRPAESQVAAPDATAGATEE